MYVSKPRKAKERRVINSKIVSTEQAGSTTPVEASESRPGLEIRLKVKDQDWMSNLGAKEDLVGETEGSSAEAGQFNEDSDWIDTH